MGQKDMNIEYATLSFNVESTKELKQIEGGPNIGVFSGHLAAFAKDRMDDVFLPGAFKESLDELKLENRPLRMLFQHSNDNLIGGFPSETLREDDIGLFVVGNINLDVQRGKESFALMKQGVLTDMSIGFSIDSKEDIDFIDGVRIIKKVTVWEGSLVGEPANVGAKITDVKGAVPFQDLPLASRDHPWDSSTAVARVREFTDSTESPSSAYRKAFSWFDSADSSEFGAYKLPIGDVIDGRLTAVPRAIFAAAAALQGARGGVDIPEDDRAAVIRNLERYYAKMDLDSPFDEKQYFITDDVKSWSQRDLEKFLRSTGKMSKSAAKSLASLINPSIKAPGDDENNAELRKLSDELESFKKAISGACAAAA